MKKDRYTYEARKKYAGQLRQFIAEEEPYAPECGRKPERNYEELLDKYLAQADRLEIIKSYLLYFLGLGAVALLLWWLSALVGGPESLFWTAVTIGLLIVAIRVTLAVGKIGYDNECFGCLFGLFFWGIAVFTMFGIAGTGFRYCFMMPVMAIAFCIIICLGSTY